MWFLTVLIAQNKYLTSQEYQTSNIFAQEFTKLSQESLKEMTQVENPILKNLE
jgi:hypothetical protein